MSSNDQVKLIDVTLRDGGYLTQFHFDRDVVKKHIQLCGLVGVDYVEIGYRNGTLLDVGEMGESGWCDRNYLSFCRGCSDVKLAVMVHPSRVGSVDLHELKLEGVSAVRVVFDKKDPELSYGVIEEALKLELDVFVNLTRISEYPSLVELESVLSRLSGYSLKAVYLADSNGSLTPKDVRRYIRDLLDLCGHNAGFHAHDNLGLAQANALAAIEAGASFVDGSMLGLGKGRGNAKTEDIVMLLNRMCSESYDLKNMLKLYKMWLEKGKVKKLLGRDISLAMVSGMKNLNAVAVNKLKTKHWWEWL